MIIKGLVITKMMYHKSEGRRHVVDCVQQVFQQSFDWTENLEALEINLSNIYRLYWGNIVRM